MQKKLTLSIDEDLIKFAHVFSKKTNQSISRIIEEYLKQLKKMEYTEKMNLRIENLYGIFENEPIPDKKEIRKAFYEKSNH